MRNQQQYEYPIKQDKELNYSYFDATGKLAYQLTNDYLFRAVMQKSNTALKGLICSLLHLKMEEITSAVISNPIELGDSIDQKTYILDIKVVLNDRVKLNIELQVLNQGNWPERSMEYLCRSFDQVARGRDYLEAMPVVQIGILDFTLFPEVPEFYATYKFMNVKNYWIYSDKVRISVVDLTQIGLATEEDKSYGIDQWARFFIASTWEEVKMMAKTSESMEEAVETIYRLLADEKVRSQCEAREDYYRQQRYVLGRMEAAEKREAEANRRMAEAEQKAAEVEQKAAEAEQKAVEAERKSARLQERLEELLAENERLRRQAEGRQ